MARNPQTFRMSEAADKALELLAKLFQKTKTDLVKEQLRDLAGMVMIDAAYPLSDEFLKDELPGFYPVSPDGPAETRVLGFRETKPDDVFQLYIRYSLALDISDPYHKLVKDDSGKYFVDSTLFRQSAVFRDWLTTRGIDLALLGKAEATVLERVYRYEVDKMLSEHDAKQREDEDQGEQ